jgi:DHA3 family macrolide efflux protein-like MFS transporter
VDRWNRRWTMLLSDTGAGLSILAITLLLFAGQLELWHIYVATAVNSAFSAFQWPAYNAAITLLVPKKQLGRANGMIQMSVAIAQLAAPLLGALLLELIKLEGVILLDFVSFLCAALALLCLRFPKRKAQVTSRVSKGLLLREVRDGWIYIASRPGLLGLFRYFAAFSFLIGAVEVLVTPLVLSLASTVVLGTILSVGGSGMLVGGLVMSVYRGPEQRMMAVFGCMLLCGLWLAVAGLSTFVPLLAISAFFFFLGLPMINACGQVIVQKKVAPDLQGRVFALRDAIQHTSLPLGYVVAGPLADYVFEPLMAVMAFWLIASDALGASAQAAVSA